MELDLQVPNEKYNLDHNYNVSPNQPIASYQLANNNNNNRWVIPAMQNMSLRARRSASTPEQLVSVLEQVCIVQNVGYTAPVYTTFLSVQTTPPPPTPLISQTHTPSSFYECCSFYK